MSLSWTSFVVAAALSVGCKSAGARNPPAPPPPYNPYPPGILPADLESETQRVRREIKLLFQEALAEANTLPPPVVTGQPRGERGSGYRAIQTLGKLMNYDENISASRNVACASCHMPYAGFSGPIPSVNLTMIAYPGTYHFRAGKRTAQRYTYSPWFPVLEYDAAAGAFFGGNFFDSRATGYRLQNPDAEQAQGPPVDKAEMGLPDTACVAFRLGQSNYRKLFERVWGAGSLDIPFPPDTEKICSTPGGTAAFGQNTTPVKLTPAERTRANVVYDRWAQSLDAFERSTVVSPFTSKFDAFLGGKYTMTPDEKAGYELFRGRGNCNSCHIDGRATALARGQTDTGNAGGAVPLFTCFGSANEGVPFNPRVAFYYETKPDFFGFVPNPDGFGYRDLGMGTFLRGGTDSPNPNSDWTSLAPKTDGQFQVSTLRDVALASSQCPTTEAPGPYFQKEFFHNGYFKSLKQIVHFYNTRDLYAYPVTSGHCPEGTIEKVSCWPMPEVKNNIDMTTGNLGLSDKEENQVVAFLQTLTDGYTAPYPGADKFTGKCMSGGEPSTQGNDSLIPTPPLPPCAKSICGVQPLPDPVIP